MKENIEKIQEYLKKYNIKMWFLVNKDNADPIFYKYISKHLYTLSCMFILQNRSILIINKQDEHNIDFNSLKDFNIEIYVFENEDEMLDIIEGVICKLEYVEKIALSYSTLSDKDADILSHMDFKKYTGILRNIYKKYHKKVRFCSSEKVVYSLIAENSTKKLERIKLVTKITHEVLDITMKNIFTNMSEIDIASQVKFYMREIALDYIGQDLVNIDLAWENCPFVLIGENIERDGHTPASNKILNKGDTIYIDFGIKAVFSDGKKIYSDMQRMGYALKDNEKKAPKKINKVFNTLRSSIDDVLDYMKPDVKGYVIDEMVRNKIVKAGYPNYLHSSGHPVGSRVHGIGTIIGNKLEPRSKIPFVDTGVYTLEPKIATIQGGSIEEMIQVTKFGGIPVYKFQEELYLIK